MSNLNVNCHFILASLIGYVRINGLKSNKKINEHIKIYYYFIVLYTYNPFQFNLINIKNLFYLKEIKNLSIKKDVEKVTTE